MENMYVDLAGLSKEDLVEVVRERLHGHDAGGPPLDCRGDMLRVLWLKEAYAVGDANFCKRLDIVVTELLGEICDRKRWPEPARNFLLLLLQFAGGLSAEQKLLELLEQQKKRINKKIAAGLLKSLHAHGRFETVEFWLDWFSRLGPRYGSRIFLGLVEHGTDVAMKHLPDLTADVSELLWISLCLPRLEMRYGRQQVVSGIHQQWPRLSTNAKAVFGEKYGVPIIER